MSLRQQIKASGVANQSGLEVFATTTTFNGEYINWGDAFAYGSQLNNDPDYTTNDVENGAIDALVNAPNTTAYQWMRYHGNGSKLSHSGIYQKLSLIKGVEYQIELRTPINPNTGTITIETYTPFEDTFLLTSTESITYPVIRSKIGLITSLFTARSGRDLIVIYFKTTATSSTDVTITNISIKEKQDYLTPVYAEDRWGNSHQVLRRNLDNPTFNT